MFVADFHIHSKYSRATSKDMDLEALNKWAKIKGIKVLGTGDFTHPEWLKNLKEKLEPAEPGLYKLRKLKSEVRFILTAEISCIYSKNNKVRKVHILVFSPSFEVCDKINTQLGWIGNLKSDGRPILGLDAKELAKIVLESSQDCLIIPAHIWTPWFSIFGSKSGFDLIEECFEEYSKYIYAVESGLSSDPLMNWRLSALDNIALISNSDSHSPQKIGREANVFDCELNYFEIIKAIKEKNPKKFLYTTEFFPEEGKYHFDGHRLCKISFSPEETIKHNYLCPVCSKKVTVGVMHRVDKLADRADGFRPEGAPLYYSTIPLCEIVAETLKVGVNSKAVMAEYFKLLKNLGNEYRILMDVSIPDIESAGSPVFSEAISRGRSGDG